MKRLLDVFVATFALLLLLPAILLVALAIWTSAPGPIIYRQTRLGKHGKPFTMFKFRTMHPRADSAIHRQHLQQILQNSNVGPGEGKTLKLDSDPRITQFGHFLRRTSLDELPQLFNVLRGEMSLVGPRPPLPYEVEEYEDWQIGRLRALPGLTGLWQVSGRSEVPFHDMVRLDLHYIRILDSSDRRRNLVVAAECSAPSRPTGTKDGLVDRRHLHHPDAGESAHG